MNCLFVSVLVQIRGLIDKDFTLQKFRQQVALQMSRSPNHLVSASTIVLRIFRHLRLLYKNIMLITAKGGLDLMRDGGACKVLAVVSL